MAEQNDLFADGLGAIIIDGGTVRLDFASRSATEVDSNGRPRLIFRQRVIMTVEGFARAVAAQQQVMAKLIADGAIAAPAPAGVSEVPAAADKPRSPNFS